LGDAVSLSSALLFERQKLCLNKELITAIFFSF